MSTRTRLVRRSTLTGVANVLFAGGVVLLFVAIYQQNRGIILVTASVLLACTIAAWIAAAYAPRGEGDTSPEYRRAPCAMTAERRGQA